MPEAVDTMNKTKAKTLIYLKDKLKKSYIEDIFVFTVKQWDKDKKNILSKIKDSFYPRRIIVRSSAVNEDSKRGSLAGHYKSVLGVDSKSEMQIKNAVNQVISSYNDNRTSIRKNEILAQPQIDNILMSGLVFHADKFRRSVLRHQL